MTYWQVNMTGWQVLILINLVEKELARTKDREFEKRNELALLKNSLQAQSLGPKPFAMQVNI